MQALVRKAGYRGALTPVLLESMSVTRYQSSKMKLSHKEHKEAKELQLQQEASSVDEIIA